MRTTLKKSDEIIQLENAFLGILFSWSLEDIFNEQLFQVPKLPTSFESTQHYFQPFVLPLLEETRAELESALEVISNAPFADVKDYYMCEPYGTCSYDVVVGDWRNRKGSSGNEPYKTLPGDILVFADAKPETVSDLERVGRSWSLALVTSIPDDDDDDNDDDGDDQPTTNDFKVRSSNWLKVVDKESPVSGTVIYLINITTNRRIWCSLHMSRNLNVIKKVLSGDTLVNSNCSVCYNQVDSDLSIGCSNLNSSQKDAVFSCLRRVRCNHVSGLELIKGPPGTGKTSTVSTLLVALLQRKFRTLTCTPTNVAIKEVASRVLKLLKKSAENDDFLFPLGDILLFGNNDRLKIDKDSDDVSEIYLEHRVEMLEQCFGSTHGWLSCLSSVIGFLENSVEHFSVHQENARKTDEKLYNSFLDYARERFCSIVSAFRNSMITLCTHLPANDMGLEIIEAFNSLTVLLASFESFLFCDSVQSNELEQLLTFPELVEDSSKCYTESSTELCFKRTQCISSLRALNRILHNAEFPSLRNTDEIQDFCFWNASLIFCTASSSYNLNSMIIKPLEVLVIDEAAQLKECESTIPLQLPGIRHAILIGDECQLPAMVRSTAAKEAGFGRSLFERLTLLQHPVHLLDIQYRMHPCISNFPNSTFYSGSIKDGDNVKAPSYLKCYLPGEMFGPYSFLNVRGGREEMDDVGHSRRNMSEVAIVLKLLQNLYKGWSGGSDHKISIGVISPYAAQAIAIRKKLPEKYEKTDGFSVKVKSVDGFQGGEEDIIIISTVRCNKSGAIGFLSNAQRTNVALTRARHCLWILGCATTLINSESVWQRLVHDAKARNCFFNIDEDESLGKVVLDVKKQYDQLEDLITGDSLLFRNAKWKVLFSDYFKTSFGRLNRNLKITVLDLLLRISGGWRPKKKNVDIKCERSSHVLKQFKVERLYVICSVDITKDTLYTQVLKVWDILPLDDVRKLVNRLEGIFATYTDEFVMHCNEKCYEGDLETPKTWSAAFEFTRYKSILNDETASDSTNEGMECYVENTRVSDSLLLMKFYSLSSGVVKFLLSDNEGKELELPFEVTEEEQEVIMFPRSMFILGRSGTGKTTVLTMKLFKKEQLYHMAVDGLEEGTVVTNSSMDDWKTDDDNVLRESRTVLKQLFVTVSGKLCHAVKHHVSQLKSFASGGKYSAESSGATIGNIDDMVQFKDIPDSFVEIPPYLFPIVITLFKFLMMVDGTIGSSYFERFPDARQFLHSKAGNLGSLGLQAFIKTREVNYGRFASTYWPHFNARLTSKFDPSRVFTEIMSHIKGGLIEGWSSETIFSRSDYLLLSNNRASSLDGQQREMIYEIYEDYEKMKMERGDFDMADLVLDLHRRLKTGKYKGELMDYVYIDEVQDLTMRQIAIFKHVCKNINEGYIFSGDTAQTIARGIDFRFEDIRSLFYNEFICDAKKEKGQISKIFHLSQNFRTHAGVLKLAQSVIDLLYHFFPSSIDKLSKETSRIFGESPVLLEAGSDENAIMTIFGNKSGGHFVGFGAQQVILVRDDDAKKDVYSYVGKQALVLTIVECKGLEFQDVLLYNFFGSSPLGNKWRVVYDYMGNQSLLDQTMPQSFSRFDLSKHNIMCSELKLLYVAITRTRQRLWICENVQECSEPMFNYWKKKGLVQVRKLDEELAQAMQVASNPEEWKAQGYKLLREGNYEMATVCFERAGDEYGEKLAKAAGLRASADIIHCSNPEEASVARRQAADIFESIGKADYAAECFYMLKDYEKAGKQYLLCGESAKVKAGECFCLAGSYKLAADVYFDASNLSRCLSACTEGMLFDEGLLYIQQWKQGIKASNSGVKHRTETEKMQQEFLERAALHYNQQKDRAAMMRYVKTFDSLESMRTFLRSLGCLDELLSLEEEYGNFMEAASIARSKGEVITEADLLGKASRYTDASALIMSYVLGRSLWSSGCKGWPLKQFELKKSLLEKAKSLAKVESEQYLDLVSIQAEILLNENDSLRLLQQHLAYSQRLKSIGGQILSSRKIIDSLLQLNISKYVWVEEMVLDVTKLSADELLSDNASLETLVYCWTLWKNPISDMISVLEDAGREDIVDLAGYGEFCLSFFGVRRFYHNGSPMYVLLNSDAQWTRDMDRKFLWRNGELTCIDVKKFFSLARSYWCSELLSVGIAVLKKLEALNSFSSKNSLSSLCMIKWSFYINEVARFLLDSNFLDRRFSDNNVLERHIKLSSLNFFGCLFSLDWRESGNRNMVSFRRTEECRNFLRESVIRLSRSDRSLSYGQLGRMAVMILGSAATSFHGSVVTTRQIRDGSTWNKLISYLLGRKPETGSDLESVLHGALFETYNINWRKVNDYISPNCFLYLLERQLILISSLEGLFITSKSACVEWIINQEGRNDDHSNVSKPYSPESVPSFVGFITRVTGEILQHKKNTIDWIKASQMNVQNSYGALVLRLVALVCLVDLNFGAGHNLISNLRSWKHVTEQLPRGFYNKLRRGMTGCFAESITSDVVAEAFKLIGNPLVVVSLRRNISPNFCPKDAVFVNMTNCMSIDDALGKLHQEINDQTEAVKDRKGSDGLKQSDAASGHAQLRDALEVLPSGNQVEGESSHVQTDPSTEIQVQKTRQISTKVTDTNPSPDMQSFLMCAEALNMDQDMLKKFQDVNDGSGIDSSLLDELIEKLDIRSPTTEQILSYIQQNGGERLFNRNPNTGIEGEKGSSTTSYADERHNPNEGRIDAEADDDDEASEMKTDSRSGDAAAGNKEEGNKKEKKQKNKKLNNGIKEEKGSSIASDGEESPNPNEASINAEDSDDDENDDEATEMQTDSRSGNAAAGNKGKGNKKKKQKNKKNKKKKGGRK
ncbi:TPR and ankyrin repeat-containing protein 1 [Linum perenne]